MIEFSNEVIAIVEQYPIHIVVGTALLFLLGLRCNSYAITGIAIAMGVMLPFILVYG